MGRKNFFERIEQNLNLQNEYEKLEKSIKKPKDEKTIDELIDENRLANKTIKGF